MSKQSFEKHVEQEYAKLFITPHTSIPIIDTPKIKTVETCKIVVGKKINLTDLVFDEQGQVVGVKN